MLNITGYLFYYEAFATTLIFLLGFFIYLKDKANRINQFFFLLTIVIAGYVGGNFLLEFTSFYGLDVLFAQRLTIFFAALHPPFLVAFAWYFPKKEKLYKFKHFLIITIPALFFSLISFSPIYIKKLYVIDNIRYGRFEFFYKIFACYFVIFVIYSFLVLLKKGIKTKNSIEKQQIAVVLSGCVISYIIGSVFSLILPILNVHKYEIIGPIGVITLFITITYAISKYSLFNIRVIITKTTSYLILIPFIIASALWVLVFNCSLPIKAFLISIMAMFWAFCGYKILELVQSPLNRAILKQTYHIETLIQNLSKALASILDADEAVKETLSLLKHCLHFSYAHVFMFSASANQFEYRTLAAHTSSSLTLPAQGNIVRFFNENQNAIAFKDLPPDIKSEFDRSLKDPKAILFPIYSLQTVYGLIIFGPKTTQLPYTEHDTALFVSLLNMLRFVFKRIDFHEQLRSKSSNLESQVEEAVLVQQKMASELEQKQKMEAELQIASDIQKRLLPHAAPAVANFRMHATFIPARIVSGDYYQFFPFSETELGIVIADIVGKGIAASYGMFIIHALLSKFIDGKKTPKDMMALLNQIFCSERAIQKYVPLTYAKLNTKTKTITYCNAGHQPPLLISGSEIKELTLSSFPLKMDQTTEYEEETIPLLDNDRVLFFTDGLTEAKNTNKEFYGLDRLRGVCKKNSKVTGADSRLTDAILADWRQFSSDMAQQTDDLTLIEIECAPLKVFR